MSMKCSTVVSRPKSKTLYEVLYLKHSNHCRHHDNAEDKHSGLFVRLSVRPFVDIGYDITRRDIDEEAGCQCQYRRQRYRDLLSLIHI